MFAQNYPKHFLELEMNEQNQMISIEEEPYMMTTMLLNVRMSQNRSRLIENKKFISDQLRVIEQGCVLSERRKARLKLIEKYNAEQAKSMGNAQNTQGGDNEGKKNSPAPVITPFSSSEENQEEEEMNDDYWEINGKLAVAKNKTTLTSQKVEATKAMIRSSASLAMEDATYTFGTIFLFITLIRLVPFLEISIIRHNHVIQATITYAISCVSTSIG